MSAKTTDETGGAIGGSPARVGGLARVTGRQAYVADLPLDGLLHVKLVTVDHARARIDAIDATAALAVPGVLAVLTAADVVALQARVREVRVEPVLADYVLDLVEATRTHPEVTLGASTRAGLALYRATQALALIEGRAYIVPDDIKRLARPVLAHRLLVRRGRAGAVDAAGAMVDDIVRQTPVPG